MSAADEARSRLYIRYDLVGNRPSEVNEDLLTLIDDLEERVERLEPPTCECPDWETGPGPHCRQCGLRIDKE